MQVLPPRSNEPTHCSKCSIKTSAVKKRLQVVIIGDMLVKGTETPIDRPDPPHREAFCLLGTQISGSLGLYLMGYFNFSDTNWEYHIVIKSKSGKYLKHVEDNVLIHVFSEWTRKCALPVPFFGEWRRYFKRCSGRWLPWPQWSRNSRVLECL